MSKELKKRASRNSNEVVVWRIVAVHNLRILERPNWTYIAFSLTTINFLLVATFCVPPLDFRRHLISPAS